jgi:heme a synthase
MGRARVRSAPMTSWLASKTTLVRLAVLAIVTNVAIVVTGGIVRLTGSGLGCPDWPTCDGARVVPSPSAGATWHTAIEFGNRLMTFAVLAAVVAVWLSARAQRPRRRSLERLALALPLGVLAQAVLGGITVLTGLHPLTVAAHFLLSMVLIAFAVAVHDRAVERPVVTTERLRRLALVLIAVAATVLVAGTLVTAAGPHAGDPGTPRLGLDIRWAARTHAGLVWATVLLTVATLVTARRAGADRITRAATVLLGVEVAQGAVGYLQYALGIPAGLVAVHLVLACLFWVAVLRVALAAGVPALPARDHAHAASPSLAG